MTSHERADWLYRLVLAVAAALLVWILASWAAMLIFAPHVPTLGRPEHFQVSDLIPVWIAPQPDSGLPMWALVIGPYRITVETAAELARARWEITLRYSIAMMGVVSGTLAALYAGWPERLRANLSVIVGSQFGVHHEG